MTLPRYRLQKCINIINMKLHFIGKVFYNKIMWRSNFHNLYPRLVNAMRLYFLNKQSKSLSFSFLLVLSSLLRPKFVPWFIEEYDALCLCYIDTDRSLLTLVIHYTCSAEFNMSAQLIMLESSYLWIRHFTCSWLILLYFSHIT